MSPPRPPPPLTAHQGAVSANDSPSGWTLSSRTLASAGRSQSWVLTDTGRTGKAGGQQDWDSLLWLQSELSSEELPGLLLVGLETSSRLIGRWARQWLSCGFCWARRTWPPGPGGCLRGRGLPGGLGCGDGGPRGALAASACVSGTASPEGQGGAPMSSTWRASELWPQPDRAGGRPPHSLPWLKAFPKKESK